MAPTAIAILSLLVLGLPATLAVDRRARGPLLLGAAFLYGSGVIFLVMLALSIVHIRWSMTSVGVAAMLAFVGCTIAWRFAPAPPPHRPATPPRPHWLDLFTALTMAGYALYATIAPLWEWDFWAIWGLKARVFLESGGIDWRFLESRWNTFAHADYPLLVPFNYAFIALANGEWSDRWLGAIAFAWAVAVLLIVRDLAARETTPLVAALITICAATTVTPLYIGLAEGPLIAFGGAAVLFLRRGILFDDDAAWRHGAILLGFAANVKNEGVALCVAVVIGILCVKRRSILRLWPAAVVAAPWLLLRAAHVLPTDIVGGSVLERIASRVPFTVPILNFLWEHLYEPWFWVAIVAAIVIAPHAQRKREAFVLITTGVQLVFYVASYFATPHDPRWHILTSWPRLSGQIALPITVAVLMMLAVAFPRGQESAPNAEARPVD